MRVCVPSSATDLEEVAEGYISNMYCGAEWVPGQIANDEGNEHSQHCAVADLVYTMVWTCLPSSATDLEEVATGDI